MEGRVSEGTAISTPITIPRSARNPGCYSYTESQGTILIYQITDCTQKFSEY